ERDCQHKCKPNRRDKDRSPHRTLEPRKIAAAARQISTFAQRIDESGIFENDKLLPKQNVHEKPAEHPNLQKEQTQREKDQQQRRPTRKSDGCDRQPKYDQQKEHAVDENAQRSNARPESDSLI